jgi:group II intron reverse transcriptase/maturase
MPTVADVLAWRNLCLAWEKVADNRGAPGVDSVSIGRFARHWEDNLRRLHDMVNSGRYSPSALRRIAIPKAGGGQRLLSIPTVADRVVQRAVLNVLEPVFEKRFLPCSYGYRPGRSLRDAVAAILRHRDARLTCVLSADIDDCFASLSHGRLIAFLREDIQDAGLLRLISRWLESGQRDRRPERGIPLGMPLSPLCCNVYLHRLDEVLTRNGWALVRYADDFIIQCASADQARTAQQVVSDTLAALDLRLEPRKTHIASFARGFDYLGVHFEGQSYRFLWKDKRIQVAGPTPWWLWGYIPDDYDG